MYCFSNTMDWGNRLDIAYPPPYHPPQFAWLIRLRFQQPHLEEDQRMQVSYTLSRKQNYRLMYSEHLSYNGLMDQLILMDYCRHKHKDPRLGLPERSMGQPYLPVRSAIKPDRRTSSHTTTSPVLYLLLPGRVSPSSRTRNI
jgi:hypothetical protein